MNLTYNLPKDFKEDEAVVSLAQATRYANDLQFGAMENGDKLAKAVESFIEKNSHKFDYMVELVEAWHEYLGDGY